MDTKYSTDAMLYVPLGGAIIVSSFLNLHMHSQFFDTTVLYSVIGRNTAANHSIRIVGPAPQPLQFHRFPGQQAPQNRNTPLGSGRLQNAKIGPHTFSDNVA